jgi:ribosomal protein S18 acetylase RimI-like enzyme
MTGWSQLEQFLQTDPRDVGCERALAVLHVYVELVLAGEQPELQLPGVTAHLSACGPCNEDFEGLLAAARDGRLADAVPPVRIEQHSGPRDSLRHLFEEAEDSPEQLAAYIDDGVVLVALDGRRVVAHLQLVGAEIKNMAVDEAHRGRGIGRALIDAAAELARSQGARSLVVATAAADIGNLRFYQRAGFRLRSVDRDAFTPATGYPPDLVSDGIPLRDRVWLDLDL